MKAFKSAVLAIAVVLAAAGVAAAIGIEDVAPEVKKVLKKLGIVDAAGVYTPPSTPTLAQVLGVGANANSVPITGLASLTAPAATTLAIGLQSFTATSGTVTALTGATGTFSGAGATTTAQGFKIAPTISYTGGSTGKYEALIVAPNETNLPSGQNLLAAFRAGATGTSDRVLISNGGTLFVTDNGSLPTGHTLADAPILGSFDTRRVMRFLSAGGATQVVLGRSNNTTASPNPVVDADVLATWLAQGYTSGATFQGAAYIYFVVDGTPGGANVPGRIEFRTSGAGGLPVWCVKDSGNLHGKSASLLAWCSSTDPTVAPDTAIGRVSAGLAKVTDGSSTNYASIGNGGFRAQAAGVHGWAASTDATAAFDAGFSRTGAAAGAFGNGTSGDGTGTLTLQKLSGNSTATLTLASGTGRSVQLEAPAGQGVYFAPNGGGATFAFLSAALTGQNGGSQITWATGCGALTHILGPTDQHLTMSPGTGKAFFIQSPSGQGINFQPGGGGTSWAILSTALTGQNGGAQITWATGCGAITHLLGPSDQNLLMTAGSAASGTTGRSLSITAGPATGTNIQAGDLNLLAGTPTGTGYSKLLVRSGFVLASGSTAQTLYDRELITSKTFACSTTTATANTFLLISNAVSNSGVGSEIQYTLEVLDGSNHAGTITGSMWVVGANANGTVTADATTASTANQIIKQDASATFGTLTCTTTATVSGTNVQCKVTPSWSTGTPTTVRITYQARLSGQGSATPQ